MLNVVIPAAGLSSRFSKVGYETPKPFIDVDGEEMIVRAINNLKISNAKYIVILQKEHANKFKTTLEKLKKEFNVEFVLINSPTEGMTNTVLEASNLLKDDDELLILSSDQIVDFNLITFINHAKKRELDGFIITFKDLYKNPKWFFLKNKDDLILKINNKKTIKTHINTGIYYFKKSKYFKTSATNMIKANNKEDNEFYIAQTYNYLENNQKIGIFKINKEQMYELKTPKDLDKYLKLDRFIIEQYINKYEFSLLNQHIVSKLLNKQTSFDFLKYAFLSAQFGLFFQIYNTINSTNYILKVDCLKSDGVELLKEFTTNNKKHFEILKEYFDYFSNMFDSIANIYGQKITIEFNDFIIIGCYILKMNNNILSAESIKNIVPFLKKANALHTQVLSVLLMEYFILKNEEEKRIFFEEVTIYNNFINLLFQVNYQKSSLKFMQYNELTNQYYIQRYKYSRQKRYAVCLYGILRGNGWTKSIEKIITDISKYFEADFFLFAWDECQMWANCSPWTHWANRFFKPHVFQKIPKCIASTQDFKTLLPLTSECFLKKDIRRKITKEEINNLLKNNPKIRLSNFESEPNHHKKLFVANLYYGQLASFNLLKQYEKQNNIEYDIVMLCRNDLEIININMDIIEQLKVGEIAEQLCDHGIDSTHFFGHRSAINEYVKFYEDYMYNYIIDKDFNYGNHRNLFIYSQLKKIKYKPKALKDSLFFRNIIFDLKLPHFNEYLEQDLSNSILKNEEKEQIRNFFKLLSEEYAFA